MFDFFPSKVIITIQSPAGYNYYGTEKLYSGIDGREMEADIFFGIVHYQRLRHMVSDKFQVNCNFLNESALSVQLTHLKNALGSQRGSC